MSKQVQRFADRRSRARCTQIGEPVLAQPARCGQPPIEPAAMNRLSSSIALLLLISASAQADDSKRQHLELTAQRGMQQLSDGLYARASVGGASLVATNEAGKLELAVRVDALRAQLQQRFARTGQTPVQRQLLERLQQTAAALRAEAALKIHPGLPVRCSLGSEPVALATASEGSNASAQAVNQPGYDKAADSYNEVWTFTDRSSRQTITAGPAGAEASVLHVASCVSVAHAQVNCPAQEFAVARAIAWSFSQAPACNR